MSDKINIKVVVAPLDWGLGHATRCIPLIKCLIALNCKVIIAAKGPQEILLKREFPALSYFQLPGYGINYSANKRFFPVKILFQVPKILKAIKREKKWIERYATENNIDLIISDNRYGLYHSAIPSVFITHQLLIKAPFSITEKILQWCNYRLISKFTTCWVPDEKGDINLAGNLSHPAQMPGLPVQYIGGLSRLNRQTAVKKKYDVLIIISGPEPQRSIVEKKMIPQLSIFTGTALLVRGLPGDDKVLYVSENITVRNHLAAVELETAFNESEYIISRSGYTTVMDICKLQKKAILVPTPGQTEQEYLAAHLAKQGWCLAASQHNFSLSHELQRAKNFTFSIPAFAMESYKDIVKEYIEDLRK